MSHLCRINKNVSDLTKEFLEIYINPGDKNLQTGIFITELNSTITLKVINFKVTIKGIYKRN